jgi:hypothetical protein
MIGLYMKPVAGNGCLGIRAYRFVALTQTGTFPTHILEDEEYQKCQPNLPVENSSTETICLFGSQRRADTSRMHLVHIEERMVGLPSKKDAEASR